MSLVLGQRVRTKGQQKKAIGYNRAGGTDFGNESHSDWIRLISSVPHFMPFLNPVIIQKMFISDLIMYKNLSLGSQNSNAKLGQAEAERPIDGRQGRCGSGDDLAANVVV